MNSFSFTPFPELVTQRLLLRQITKEDENEIFEMRSNPVVLKYLDRNPATIDESRAWINHVNDLIDKNEAINWAITLKNETKLFGIICIWHVQLQHQRAEVGYTMLPDFFGKGYMNEALNAVLDYGFNMMKLHSVEALVNPANAASIKLLGKNKFIREAYFKENYFYNGKFLDTAIYSLINPKT